MITALQWTVLTVCLLCTAWRVPSVVRGHNRGLFWAFVMASISVALSIPAIYLPVDAWLGGENLANVVLRMSLFAVFYLLAGKVAAAYNSPFALKLIRGPLGLSVLFVCSVGVVISYFLSEVSGSSTGLNGFGEQPSVRVYFWLGSAYTAYAAACLVQPTAQTALSRNRPAMDRVAAGSLCVGFSLVVMTVPLKLLPTSYGSLVALTSFTSILFVAAGLVIVWLSFIRNPVRPPAQS